MKNKKTKIYVAAVVILLALVAAFFVFNKKEKSEINSNNKQESSKSIFTSVKDAMSKNITLVCEFKDESGSSTKSYIKNGAVRVSSLGQGEQSGEIIMKDKKMYMWDIKTKTGFVYEIPDADATSDNSVGMTSSEVVKSESYLDMIEKNKDFCKVSAVEDSYFVIPADVNFQDMSKFLEDLKSQVPQINIPTE